MKQLKQILIRGHSPTKNHFKPLLTIKPKIIMKAVKLFIVVTLLFVSNTYGQLNQKNWLVGGSANIAYTKSTPNQVTDFYTGAENKITSLLIEPNIGYFIKDKFVVGIKLGASNSYNSQDSFKINQTQLSISPFIRFYILNIEKTYNLFFEPSYFKYTYKPLGNVDGYGLKLGHVYFLNSSIGFETSINYQKRNGINFDTDEMFLGCGFQLYLEKK